MPTKANTTSAVRRPPDSSPSPSSDRASTPAGWLRPRPTRRPTVRLWRQGCRTPGQCDLLDRVARQPRSTRRHPQRPMFQPFVWHPGPQQEPLLRGQARPGEQRNGHGPGPKPTGPRFDTGDHSHLAQKHAYLINGVIAHLIPLLTDRGLSNSNAALAASMLGLLTLIGRLLTGALLDRFQGSYVGG